MLNGTSVYIDSEGLHFSAAYCTFVIDFPIANFAKQLDKLSKTARPMVRDVLLERAEEQKFQVELQKVAEPGDGCCRRFPDAHHATSHRLSISSTLHRPKGYPISDIARIRRSLTCTYENGCLTAMA